MLALTGCGGTGTDIDIDVTMTPVVAQAATRAVISLFNAPESCQVIKISRKGGVYNHEVPLPGAQRTDFYDVVPADYKIAVFVYDATNALVGFGCDPLPVTIEQGKRVERPITVEAI